MEFCLSNSHSDSSQYSGSDITDKENISPPRDGCLEGWTCWHQAVLCYWLEILCLLSLHRIIQQENSSESESDELIEVSQDLLRGSIKYVATPKYQLELPKITLDIIQVIQKTYLTMQTISILMKIFLI